MLTTKFQPLIAAGRPGLLRLYEDRPLDVQGFFGDYQALVRSGFSLDILLAYMFFRLEQGQTRALFCGARKLHKVDSESAWQALNKQHMTRGAFIDFFQKIFGFPIDADTADCIAKAEKIRDLLMHGKDVSEPQKREAISRVLQYAERMNSLVAAKPLVGFLPFTPDLRGFTGRLEAQDKSTSRWILKGMGFQVS